MATEKDSDIAPKPNATVYVQNINEHIKPAALIPKLKMLFKDFGTIIEVRAKKNIKARGQAWVVYDHVDGARNAIDELQDFEFEGKAIRVAYAKERSDATVLREDGVDALEVRKATRLAEKEFEKAEKLAEEQQQNAKRAAPDSLAERPGKTSKPAAAGGLVPDEYLPPNKILFIRDLPEDLDHSALTAIFSGYAGFKELRLVPGRKGIAFAEYEDADAATAVREVTNGSQLGGGSIRVTYQRQ